MSRAAVVSRIAHEACVSRPPNRYRRWWDELDEGFPCAGEDFALQGPDRLRVGITSAGDGLVRALGATLVTSLVVPGSYHPLRLRHAHADLELYGELAERGDPTRFFVRPPRGVHVITTPTRRPRFRPPDGVCVDVKFPSPFEPLNPRHRDEYLRWRANRTAYGRYWRHLPGPRPTVIAIHGFSADFYPVNEWFFSLPWLYRLGCDVMLVTLPFHGRRRGRTAPFSGYGFFAGGPARINEAVAQSVFDLRIFIDWLTQVGRSPAVGVMGISLGGYTSAVLASVDERVAFAVPNVPVASIPDLVMEWQPLGTIVRAVMRASGWTLRDARRLLAVSSPLTWRPRVPIERRFIIGGVGDRLAPPKHTCLLWDHWDRCRLYWFPGSHLVHIDRRGYLHQLGRFLRDTGVVNGAAARRMSRSPR